MRTYIRSKTPGAVYFFTVNLADRHGAPLLIDHVESLKEAFRSVRRAHPFDVEAMVVLPDHLHSLWRMLESDANYSTRWRLIKAQFHAQFQRVKPFLQAAFGVASAAYGNAGYGNTRSGMSVISRATWITSITTR